MGEDLILAEVERRLKALSQEKQTIDSITFSGYGESTLFPTLKTLTKSVKHLRDEYFPGVPVQILTNSSLVGLRVVFSGLKEFDAIIAKLDVGEERSFRAINRPAPGVPTLLEIVEGLRRLQAETHRVILQTLIFKSSRTGKPTNHEVSALESIAEMAHLIDPEGVQIYTIARYPSEEYIESVDRSTLELATDMINKTLGRRCAKVYY
jgi:wyosine [tRNA(Phe)-imidazoG37] synthetase (radical SAM superfamily)